MIKFYANVNNKAVFLINRTINVDIDVFHW